VAKSIDGRVRSAGDLEAVYLHETHDLLAHLIGPNYYRLLGDQVQFHDGASFSDFFIHVEEMLSGGREQVRFPGAPEDQSLLGVGAWFAERAGADDGVPALAKATESIRAWLDESPPFRFYAGDLERHIEFPLSRHGLIFYASNLGKHRLLRLGSLLASMGKLFAEHGSALTVQEVVAVRDEFQRELESRLLYLSTQLVELLGGYFQALNSVIVSRRNATDTRTWSTIRMPESISSDVFRALYATALISHSYPYSRIADFTPETPAHLKQFY